eukprot:2862508-Rhodomonas_salina.3
MQVLLSKPLQAKAMTGSDMYKHAPDFATPPSLSRDQAVRLFMLLSQPAGSGSCSLPLQMQMTVYGRCEKLNVGLRRCEDSHGYGRFSADIHRDDGRPQESTASCEHAWTAHENSTRISCTFA